MRWTQALMREVAHDERTELGLSAIERFDPYALAEAHGVPVYTLDELSAWGLRDEALRHFAGDATGQWSAALVPMGGSRLIIENAAHAPVRRRTNIAHELGHLLLEHDFDAQHIGDGNGRHLNSKNEKQADFLAAELLITEKAAFRAAFEQWDNDRVAYEYGVSTKYAQWRMSGPRVVAQRSRRK